MTKHTMRGWPITKFDSSKYRVYRFLGRSFSRNLRKRNPIAVGYKGHHGARLHLLHVILWLSPLLFFLGQEGRFIAKLQNHTDDTCICTGGNVGESNTKKKWKFRRLTVKFDEQTIPYLSFSNSYEWIDIFEQLFVNPFILNTPHAVDIVACWLLNNLLILIASLTNNSHSLVIC